jgi:hypothetical protein
MAHYINKDAFTELFRDRASNHEAICMTLHLLVRTLAQLPSLRPDREDLLDDAIQNTTVHCIERIDRFTFTEQGNAFSYYTSVATRALREFRRNAMKHRHLQLWDDDEQELAA